MATENDINYIRKRLEREWQFADDLGLPTPEKLKLFELVMLEMKFGGGFDIAIFVAGWAAKWIETRNPICVDNAVLICAAAEVPLPPSLQKHVLAAAKFRQSGQTPLVTSAKLQNENAKQTTLTLVANLVNAGASLSQACRKAAVWHSHVYESLKPIKASTIERYYVQQWRKEYKKEFGVEDWYVVNMNANTVEEALRARWNKSQSEDDRALWRLVLDAIPEATGAQRGRRR